MKTYTTWVVAIERKSDRTWEYVDMLQGPGMKVLALHRAVDRFYNYSARHRVFTSAQWRKALADGTAR